MTRHSDPGGSGAYVERLRAEFAAYLPRVLPEGDPERFYEACRYALQSGGKYIRPTLVLLAAEAFGGKRDEAFPVAAATEVFHNFTLVHDDIMDRSDVRRGRPSVHAAFGESTAILVGDYLLALSYELLGAAPAASQGRIRTAFAAMVRRLCEGQALDMHLGSGIEVTMADYLDMIDRKTGALLACCLEVGAMVGGASDDEAAMAHRAGLDLGRAFQIQDDLLDATAEGNSWGKRRGQDLVEGKHTYLIIDMLASESANGRERFRQAMSRGGFDLADVDEATETLHEAGVLERAAADVERYAEHASAALSSLPAGQARDAIVELVAGLARRTY